MWLLAVVLALPLPRTSGEVLDRIAVTVGQSVITESEILQELRVTAFWNREPVTITPATKQETAKRLVQRTLFRRELRFSPVSAPQESEVQTLLDEFRQQEFPNRLSYGEALTRYGITEEQLKQHLREQILTLRFINERFLPEVDISPEEVEAYYREGFAKDYGRPQLPPLEEVRPQIRRLLEERSVDERLDEWLKETLSRVRIVYRPEAFE